MYPADCGTAEAPEDSLERWRQASACSVSGSVRNGAPRIRHPISVLTIANQRENPSMSAGNSFDRILTALHEAGIDDAHWPHVAELVDEACGLRSNSLVVGRGQSQQDGEVYLSRFCLRGERRPVWEAWYYDNYFWLDERVPRLARLTDGRVVHASKLYTSKELKTSLVYNEAMARVGYQNALHVRLDGPEKSSIYWTLGDPVDGNGWGTDQVRLVQRLLPHIRQFVRVRQALARAGAMGSSLFGLLDNKRVGIIQLARSGRILAANDRALGILRRRDGLLDKDGFLGAQLPADNTELQQLLAGALPGSGRSPASASMTVQRPATLHRLVLHVNPIDFRHQDFAAWPVAALVQVLEPGNWPPIDPDLVASSLGLTTTESLVAVALAEGTTVQAIASALGCQVNTVRFHVKQLHRKLGISRRGELVRLVLSLAGSADLLR